MTLTQISSLVARAIRFKLHPDEIVLVMDAAQKMAFDSRQKAFVVWDQILTPKYYIEFKLAGYTNAVAGDVGKTVVGATSGATGVLVSYDNTGSSAASGKWLLTTSDTFTDGEAITITTGTGAGTLLATASQTGYVGPYSFPTDPPVNKFWGVTAETDLRIFGSDDVTVFPMNDFDFLPRLFNPKQLFKPGRADEINGTFTFIDGPALPSLDPVYRFVYWQNPPTIDGTSDDTELLIPSSYHFNFANACIKIAQIMLSGEDVDPKVIQTFFKPWWDSLSPAYTPMGKKTNQTLNPRDSSDLQI